MASLLLQLLLLLQGSVPSSAHPDRSCPAWGGPFMGTGPVPTKRVEEDKAVPTHDETRLVNEPALEHHRGSSTPLAWALAWATVALPLVAAAP
jgi:hypothetical protein